MVVNNVTIRNTNFDPAKAEVYNYAKADLLGLKSKSVWGAKGRILKDDVVPAGVVSQAEGKSKGVSSVSPNIRDLGNGYFMVSTRWFPIYSEDQTEPKASKKEKRDKDTSSSSSPNPPLSCLPEGGQAVQKPRQSKAKHPVATPRTPPCKNAPVNKPHRAYVPDLLTDEDKANLGPDLDFGYMVMHTITYFRVTGKKAKDEYVDLSSEYCIKLFGGGGDRGKNWYRVRDRMIEIKLVEMTPDAITTDDYGLDITTHRRRGVKGSLCLGYRLCERLRHSPYHAVEITDPEVIRQLDRHKGEPTANHRWLEDNLHELTADPVSEAVLVEIASLDDTGLPKDKIDAYEKTLDMIDKKVWKFEPDDFAGRVHTNLTGLKRELRPYLRARGERLCQVDIPGSQLAFIGLEARAAERQYRKKFVDSRFFPAWDSDIYTYLGTKLGLPRKVVKLHLTQSGLFASNRHEAQKHPVMLKFAEEFPLLHSYMKMVKSYKPKPTDHPDTKEKPYRVLAQKAQIRERKFIIDTVCTRLRRERPDIWISTIHDSVVMLRGEAEFVKMTMQDEFAKLGLYPTLKVDTYAP